MAKITNDISKRIETNVENPYKFMKPSFVERYKALLGDRFESFLRYSFSFLNKSIRINTLKITDREFIESLPDEWSLEPIPWADHAFYIYNEESFDIGNLPQHQLGWVYVQEAASMIPVEALKSVKGSIDRSIVLDACASPGSKTSQIAMYNRNGLIIANEIDYKRLIPLATNIERLGITNVVITNLDAAKIDFSYDYALVDVPCSGTGTIRKSFKVLEMWSPNLVKKMASIQRKILLNIYNNLNDKGLLVYSTCTMEPEENEGIISWLLENTDARILDINLPLKRSKPILEWDGISYHKDVRKTLRIWPMDNNTSGFFVAVIQKHF